MSNSGRRRWLAGIIVSLLLACARPPGAEPVTLTVSAAADLMPALQEVGQRFTQETGIQLRFNFGSTGQLAQQIERGAPVDLFLAANLAFVEELERQGLVVPGTKALYARGRLALWTRADSPLTLERLEDLARPEVRRIAIAHPDHAPYGVAAREALQAVGLWEALQPKLVLGESVRQALLYAERGNVDAALVALSLSLASAGRWVLVPEELHQPLDQALAVIRGTRHEPEARQLAAYLTGPQGRSILQKYGFMLPGEVWP
jgi:molybdate transport system substrate-binding protein